MIRVSQTVAVRVAAAPVTRTGLAPNRVDSPDTSWENAKIPTPHGTNASPAWNGVSRRMFCRNWVTKKKMAKIDPPRSSSSRFALTRLRLRNSASGVSGASIRRSTATKAANNSTPTAASVSGSGQASDELRIRA